MSQDSTIQPAQQGVLVLGGTGSIGGAVADELFKRNYNVTCLARSDESELHLCKAGFNTLKGDIKEPLKWVDEVLNFDAIIHTACTWSQDMAEIDRFLVDVLIDRLSNSKTEKTLIYTGGCWSYGNTGETPATEDSLYDPLAAFDWTLAVAGKICQHPKIRGMVIHPAMVYERDGGVLEHMISDIHQLGRIRIAGCEKTRWTMVHRLDLAELYALVLEKGKKGQHYNGASNESIEISQIAKVLARRFGVSHQLDVISVEKACSQWGSWAEGYALDQSMSSEKAISQLGWQPKHKDTLADLV